MYTARNKKLVLKFSWQREDGNGGGGEHAYKVLSVYLGKTAL